MSCLAGLKADSDERKRKWQEHFIPGSTYKKSNCGHGYYDITYPKKVTRAEVEAMNARDDATDDEKAALMRRFYWSNIRNYRATNSSGYGWIGTLQRFPANPKNILSVGDVVELLSGKVIHPKERWPSGTIVQMGAVRAAADWGPGVLDGPTDEALLAALTALTKKWWTTLWLDFIGPTQGDVPPTE